MNSEVPCDADPFGNPEDHRDPREDVASLMTGTISLVTNDEAHVLKNRRSQFNISVRLLNAYYLLPTATPHVNSEIDRVPFAQYLWPRNLALGKIVDLRRFDPHDPSTAIEIFKDASANSSAFMS